MPQPHIALQLKHVPRLKHITYETTVFAQKDPSAVAGHDAGCVLSAVLNHGQRIIDSLVNGTVPNNTDNATHGQTLSLRC